MQTFLPYPDFSESLRCLDQKRLGKQRIEARQIYNSLTGVTEGWRNHPAVVMWEDNVDALALYFNLSVLHWIMRGYQNTMPLIQLKDSYKIELPSWVGDPEVHASHRGRLIEKLPEHYNQFKWTEAPISKEQGYVWPGSSSSYLRTHV